MRPHHFTSPELEPVPGTWRQAFVHSSFEQPKFDFVWHCHPEFELTFIRKGYGVRYVGESIQPFQAGDLCLLGGNLLHAYGSHPRCDETCRWTVLHFQPAVWGEDFWKLPENASIKKMLEASKAGLWFNSKVSGKARALIQRISGERIGSGSGMLSFLQLLHLLGGSKAQRLNPRTMAVQSSDRRVTQVLQWVEDHATEDIRQRDAADLLGMSAQAFSRFFRQRTGRIFVKHLIETRVALACSSLISSRKTVAEIAFESGFDNLANFNRRFREVTGMTPRQYRDD